MTQIIGMTRLLIILLIVIGGEMYNQNKNKNKE